MRPGSLEKGRLQASAWMDGMSLQRGIWKNLRIWLVRRYDCEFFFRISICVLFINNFFLFLCDEKKFLIFIYHTDS
jgi:hypothetical protein